MHPSLYFTPPLPDNLIRPETLSILEPLSEVVPGTPFGLLWSKLNGGQHTCLSGSWGFAMAFYSWLKKKVNVQFPVKDYLSSRQHQQALHHLTDHLWVIVREHQVTLDKAPPSPWLSYLYPEKDAFYIRFADLLGLNGSWQWFTKGVRFPALNIALHPFYGVYFPTRHEHLHIFDSWLRENNHFERAVDIGTGCGVIAFMLQQSGVQHIHATDINPNAIFGLKQELQRNKTRATITIEHGDLLGSFRPRSEDLVVFNPPWIPHPPKKTLDAACYYEDGFFERFFQTMELQLSHQSTLVLLFSTFALAAGVTSVHPIEKALEQSSGAFELITRELSPPGQQKMGKTSWLKGVREREVLELWVLRKR